MKEFKFLLNQTILRKYFIPIRDKSTVVEILMESIKYMLINPTIQPEDVKGEMILKIDKMNRLFFFTKDKYFSIVFPFYIKKNDDEFNIYSKTISNIDNKLISQVLSVIKSDEFNSQCSLEFAEPIYEYDATYEESFWTFLKELLLMEDGYIRYDYDKENYIKHKERGEEHLHPENHYDIFYSGDSTFKIGLKKRIPHDDFVDLLNIKTDCKYLHNA